MEDQWTCSACHNQNSSEVSFCEYCGQKRTILSNLHDKIGSAKKAIHQITNVGKVKCKQCGETNPAGVVYCVFCGNSMVETYDGSDPVYNVNENSAEGTKCSICGKENRPKAKYCAFCGRRIDRVPASAKNSEGLKKEKVCLECGEKNEASSMFCNNCGCRLDC